jgi:hypothetical protein
MVFKGTDRKLKLTGNLGGWDILGFKTMGGLEVNLNRLAARHRRGLLLWTCVDSTRVYIGSKPEV